MPQEQVSAKLARLPGKYMRLTVFLLLAVLIVVLNRRYGWTAYLADPAQLPLLQATLRQNMATALCLYMVLTIVGCVVLALPGLVFALAAGLLFGPIWGTLACVCAATIGAALAFLVGRFFLRDTLQPWLARSPRLRRLLFEQVGQRDIYVLMLTRLLPIFPYNLQNFAYGITNIRFWPYTIYSFLFMLPGTAVYTVAASGLANPQQRRLYWCLSALLLAAVIICSMLLRHGMKAQENAHE